MTTLVDAGLLAANAQARTLELSGGVSCEVVAVTAPGLDVVVKRALPRLRVAAEWLASDARLGIEAEALQLVARLTPDVVPEVLAVAEDGRWLVLERAPTGWRDWRTLLLGGVVDTTIGAQLGTLLRLWHDATSRGRLEPFHAKQGFVELRIDPFHRTVAAREPHLAAQIDEVVERLLATSSCLVHGDFSPKNVLVGDDDLWVIDWEIAHVGDPVFDVAFLCTHLLLKSAHRPQDALRHRATAAAFLAAYGPVDEEWLLANVGCLLLARVEGKSPAPYLREAERELVRTLGTTVLCVPPARLLDAWTLVPSDA